MPLCRVQNSKVAKMDNTLQNRLVELENKFADAVSSLLSGHATGWGEHVPLTVVGVLSH